MKPGKKEGSIIFETDQEIGVTVDVSAGYLSDDEYRQIKRRLQMARAPYELRLPLSDLALSALRQQADSSSFPTVRNLSLAMLENYDAHMSADD